MTRRVPTRVCQMGHDGRPPAAAVSNFRNGRGVAQTPSNAGSRTCFKSSGSRSTIPLQPLFELREDAMAMAEFDASRLWGDYGCDDERGGWWATDARGRKYRFVVEPVAAADAAA